MIGSRAITTPFRRMFGRAMPSRGQGVLAFVSTNDTITPALTVSGGPTPKWVVVESTGKTFTYEAASFSHTKTAGTGNLTVRLVNTEAVKSYVTGINFYADGIVSTVSSLQLTKLNNLISLTLFDNTNMTGDLIRAYANIDNCVYLVVPNTSMSGNFTGINLSNVVSTINIRDNQYFSGQLNTTSISSSLVSFYAYNCYFDSGIRIPVAASSLQNYQIQNNGLTQAAVDQICLDAYNNRANFTYATPTFNVGGTNAAPSGIYQDAIYKLVNDPDVEGFNKQVWTYTA
ncbi:MAG: hypothetical protein OEM02_17020 [Desulfobulbaceae bacterium]|nr:hypothetical protein [Desulfobulbaceae bacterium]